MYMYDAAFNYALGNECNSDEVVKHEKDKGGITKYGISFRFLKSLSNENLKKYGIYVGDSVDEQNIIDLTLDQAKAIYKGEFWDVAPFERINVDAVRNYIFDMAVNSGVAPAIKCAQRACWATLDCREKVKDDGIMGTITLHNINCAGTNLLIALRSERANYYKLIVERYPEQAIFLEGWLNRTYRR